MCHNVEITNDNICEVESVEVFFANLVYISGEQPIIINPARTVVIINDTVEPECGEEA